MTLKQSTAFNLMIFMADSTDHVSGKSGLTLTITASKDASAFSSISPTVTDLGSGWYGLALTTTHTNTLGCLALHITSAGADPTDVLSQVTDFTSSDVYSRVGAPAGASISADIAAIKTETDNIAAIKSKTDNLPAAPADESLVISATTAIYNRIGAPAGASVSADISAIKTETDDISAIKSKTDNLPAAPADESLVIAATTAIYSRIGAPSGASIAADIAGISTGSALGGIRKDVDLPNFAFTMFDTDGNPALNLTTISAKVRIDSSAFADCTNVSSISEVGNGWYSIDLTAADTNGKVLGFKFTCSGCKPTEFTTVTDT